MPARWDPVPRYKHSSLGEKASTLLIDEDAGLQAVVDGLHRHDTVHFACHYGQVGESSGHSDVTTGLLLGKSMTTPSFVRDLRNPTARLTCTSACATAGHDPTLLDEPLNLAAAFHLAGFRGVIGTLWYTQDSSETATAVYKTLAGGGTTPATALHLTMRGSRDKFPKLPTRWAAHVHVGD